MPTLAEYLGGLRLCDWTRERVEFSLEDDGSILHRSIFTRVSAAHQGLPTAGPIDVTRGFRRKWEDASGTELVTLLEPQVWFDLFPTFLSRCEAAADPEASVPSEPARKVVAWLRALAPERLPTEAEISMLFQDESVKSWLVKCQGVGVLGPARDLSDDAAVLFLLAEWIVGQSFSLRRVWFTGTPLESSTVSPLRTDQINFSEYLADESRLGISALIDLGLFGRQTHHFGCVSYPRCLVELSFRGDVGTYVTNVVGLSPFKDTYIVGSGVEIRQSLAERQAAVRKQSWSVEVRIESRSQPNWHMLILLMVGVGLVLPSVPNLVHLIGESSPYDGHWTLTESFSGRPFAQAWVSVNQKLIPSEAFLAKVDGLLLAFTALTLGLAWGRRHVMVHVGTHAILVWALFLAVNFLFQEAHVGLLLWAAGVTWMIYHFTIWLIGIRRRPPQKLFNPL